MKEKKSEEKESEERGENNRNEEEGRNMIKDKVRSTASLDH